MANDFEYIPNWQGRNLRCHFCGTNLSVKYAVKIFDPVVSDKPTKVCSCNKCVARMIGKGELDGT